MIKNKRASELLRTFGIVIIFIVLIAVFTVMDSKFIGAENIKNILRQVSIYAILACGMTFVVISGGIDLSVGSVLALSSCVVSLLIVKADMNIWLAALIAVLVGCLCGFLNGFFIAKLRVPFFIATAGMMYIARGAALLLTKENPVSGLPEPFKIFGFMPTWTIPPQVIIMVVFVVICYFILNHTRTGRHTYAIGSNKLAAKQSGINVDRQTIFVYTMSGLAAGISGVIIASRLQTGNPNVASTYAMDAIASVVIGGTSMAGGSGNILLSVVGALVLTVISIGLNFMKVSSSAQQVVVGCVIILVVAFDMISSNRGKLKK